MRRALSSSRFARPYIFRLISLSRLILPSTWPLDQGSTMAAATAFLSASMPAAKLAFLGGCGPRVETRCVPGAYHRVEAVHQVVRSDQIRRSGLEAGVDARDPGRPSVAFPRQAASDGLDARRRSGGFTEPAVSAATGSPFADHAKRAGEPRRAQPSPEVSADAASAGPFRPEPDQPGIERALAGADTSWRWPRTIVRMVWRAARQDRPARRRVDRPLR